MSRASSDHNEHRHIEQILTAFYTPQTDGLVDIANVQILPPVRKNVDGDIDHESEYQARTTFEVNIHLHAGLKTSQFEMLFNYIPRKITDNQLQVNIQEAQEDIDIARQEALSNVKDYPSSMKTKYDLPALFEVGNQVWYETLAKAEKFEPWYDGPYTITRRNVGNVHNFPNEEQSHRDENGYHSGVIRMRRHKA